MRKCEGCRFTDGLCYASLPPKLKCTITNEFRYYDDYCNCNLARVAQEAKEIQRIKELLDEPSPLTVLNGNGVKAADVTFVENGVTQVSTNMASCTVDVETWKFEAPVTYGSTPCLVCGEDVQIYNMKYDHPKICVTCQKAIKFVREKFKTELEAL